MYFYSSFKFISSNNNNNNNTKNKRKQDQKMSFGKKVRGIS